MKTLIPLIISMISSFLLFLFVNLKIDFATKANNLLINKFNRKKESLPLIYFFIELFIIIVICTVLSVLVGNNSIITKIILGITIGFFMVLINNINK